MNKLVKTLELFPFVLPIHITIVVLCHRYYIFKHYAVAVFIFNWLYKEGSSQFGKIFLCLLLYNSVSCRQTYLEFFF